MPDSEYTVPIDWTGARDFYAFIAIVVFLCLLAVWSIMQP
jgi:hypothetical protein